MAKAGYYAGNPQKVLSAPVDIVLGILNFEEYEVAFEAEYTLLNERDE